MKVPIRFLQYALVTTMALLPATASASSTIIKIGFGETTSGADISYDGTTLGTTDDGNAGSLGDQDTTVNFVGAFSGLFADIVSPQGSFSLSGVTGSGDATLVNNVFVQQTVGGSFELYDAANVLLLTGDLNSGAITGSLNSQTGSFFDTTIGTFTGGTLLPYLLPTSFGISIGLTGVASGNTLGFVVDADGRLQPFTSAGSGLIQGSPVPEPLTGVLVLSGMGLGVLRRRKMVSA